MKKILLFSLLFFTTSAFAYNFDNELPIKGATITSPEKQSKMLFSVYSYGLRVATPECKDFSIVNTKISKEKQNDTWEETWILKACSRTAEIPIKFYNTANDTIFSIDAKNVKLTK